jgi:hypothetical protein
MTTANDVIAKANPIRYRCHMRVAYLVLNHRPTQQIVRLTAAIRRQQPESPIVVHHDQFSCEIDLARLKHAGTELVRTSDFRISWGDFSQVRAYWETLAWTLERVECDWIVLLSGQDYPIRPLRTLTGMLESTDADAFIEAERIDRWPSARERHDREHRYLYQYAKFPSYGLQERMRPNIRRQLRQVTRIAATVINRLQGVVHIYRFPDLLPYRVGVRSSKTPFSPALPPWCGSPWNALSRRAAESLLRYLRDHPDYASYYQRTNIPDESATATILCNDPTLNIVPQNLHFIRWSHPESGHPDVFGAADISALTASDKFFGRKFDSLSDPEVLDMLDEVLLAEP